MAIRDARHHPEERDFLRRPSWDRDALLDLCNVGTGYWQSRVVPDLEAQWQARDLKVAERKQKRAAQQRTAKRREARHGYYLKNRAKVLAKAAVYRALHREEVRQYRRQYYLEHQEAEKLASRTYHAANRDREAARHRARRAAASLAASPAGT